MSDELGKAKCPTCGALGRVTLTRSGGGFMMCRSVLASGEACGTRINWPHAAASVMLKRGHGEAPRPAPVALKPAPQPQPEEGSFLGT